MLDTSLVAGGRSVPLPERRASLEGLLVELPDDEFKVLSCLIASIESEISQSKIHDDLFGVSPGNDEQIVECYVVRLMDKLTSSRFM